MRIAALIIGLLLSIWTFFEGFVIALLDTNSALAENDAEAGDAAGGGILAAMIGALAAALVIAFPLASSILFGIAGMVSLLTASAGYSNHWVYGPVFLILAVMAFFGWRGKRAAQREELAERQRQMDRDARLEALLSERR